MKIALLSDCYPPRLGGIETQIHGLARALMDAGHQPEVFTITPGPDADPWPVHRLGLPGELPAGLLVNPLARRALRARLRAGGFDVAHAHLGVVSPFAMDGVAVALGLSLPVVATWHSVTGRSEPAVRALGYPKRWARRGVALSAVSGVAAEPVRRISGTEVTVIPNGIDTGFWHEGEARGSRGDELQVVSAMRFAGRKRPRQLIDLVRRARDASGCDIRLTIAGDGPLRARLLAHQADWCALPGRLTAQELRDLYRGADLYAAPAVLEAFGIAAAEARCCGLPVITRAQSAVADLVQHERTGLVVANDEEFAAALASVGSDRSLRDRLATGARDGLPGLAWSQVVRSVLAAYRRAQVGSG